MSEDDFEPRLGRMRAGGGKRARRTVGLVVAAAARSGILKRGRGGRFDGSRIGRGAGMGRLLSSRFGAGAAQRRAVVKTRLVRLGAKGLSAARAHLRYIQRDGVTREGAPGKLYAAEQDAADGRAFLDRGDGDRHQFRFIVSAEDGDQYDDLKPLVRRLMAQVETDLGTKLDWVAVDHFNTSHPHSHIMLRGVDARGENLIIAREYIAHGLRARAAELVTLDLGPRTQLEIEARLRRDIDAERLTATDRQLLREMDAERMVVAIDRDPLTQSLRAGRLQVLRRMDLAEHVGGGRWQLAEGLETTLKAMSERGDIIRTMQRTLTERRLERRPADRVIYRAEEDPDPLVGRVVARGLADEHRDRHYLLVDATDGRTHYVDIGRGDATGHLPEGAILRIAPASTDIRDVDRTIAAVAAAHDGRYSVDLHLLHDPAASEAFAESHVRRLEAMRRTTGGVDRDPDGTWRIAPDHLGCAAALEARLRQDRPVAVHTLSPVPLERLGRADAPTWLDRELAADAPLPVREAGFGRDVRAALQVRRQWLIEQELADAAGRPRAGALALLQRRELLRLASGLAQELDRPFVEAQNGGAIEGRLARRIDAIGGRYALVERARDFTLVPWRDVLERRLGREVSGIMRRDGVSWRFGRDRGGPSLG